MPGGIINRVYLIVKVLDRISTCEPLSHNCYPYFIQLELSLTPNFGDQKIRRGGF